MSPTSYRTAPPRAKVNPPDTASNSILPTESTGSGLSQARNALLSETSNLRSEISMVGLGRVELPTSRLSGVRSNQLSYRPMYPPRHITQKTATLLFGVRSVITVDAPKGRVASAAKRCLRSTLCQIVKDQAANSNFRSEISNLKFNSISEY